MLPLADLELPVRRRAWSSSGVEFVGRVLNLIRGLENPSREN